MFDNGTARNCQHNIIQLLVVVGHEPFNSLIFIKSERFYHRVPVFR